MNATRYFAIWIVNGKETLVMPRSKKTHSFATPEAALKALESKGRSFPQETRGVVKDSDGNWVTTIAL